MAWFLNIHKKVFSDYFTSVRRDFKSFCRNKWFSAISSTNFESYDLKRN